MKWSRISEISAYKRADAHLTRQTTHGAVVTVLGVILGVTLAIHEITWYLSGKGTTKMAVDLARRHDLNIHVDITFPAIPCAGLSVDVMDASGTAGNDANHAKGVHLHKIRLDTRGRRIGGKEGEYVTPQSQKMVHDASGTVMQVDLGAAMTQMSDMDDEMQKHEGCRVYGEVSVRRVAGRLHFAVHQQSFIDVLPQMLTGHVLPKLTNMSHIIHKVAFGPEYPGQVNPLDGFTRVNRPGDVPRAYKYFLKIVPTEYYTRVGMVLESSQYSVGEYAMPLRSGPGVSTQKPSDKDKEGHTHKIAEATGAEPTDGSAAAAGDSHPTSTVQNAFVDFSYDLSPIVMTINSNPSSLLHFIVRLCAVVGGVLSVTRMADKIVHALLVSSGAVVMQRHSLGGKGPSRGYSSSSGGYSSARNSLPGDATAYVSGSPVSRGGTYGGASFNSYPVRSPSSSSGGVAMGYSAGGAAPGAGGLHPDGNLHQRMHTSHPGGGVGSHPLSRFNSGSTSYGGAPAISGGGAAPAANGVMPAMPNAGSFGGAAPNPYGGLASANSLGGSSVVIGDAIPRVGSGGSGGGGVLSSGGAAGGITPTASGQVAPLLGVSSPPGRGYSAPGGGLVHRASGGGAAAGGSFSSGGAAPAPGSYQQQPQQPGTSRLSSSSGPMAGHQFGR